MFRTRRAAAALAASLGCATALAAGGHHDVDDAVILDPGQCEVEGWVSRAHGGERLLHTGVNCRVGPVELGVAGDHSRLSGASATAWGVQVKWVAEIFEGLSAGFSLTPMWQARMSRRYQGTTLTGVLTWAVRDDLAVHANIGRYFFHHGPDDARYGASVEWKPRKGWSLLAERYREQQTHFARAGVRWAATEGFSVDLSHAYRLHGPTPSIWTLGLTIDLAED